MRGIRAAVRPEFAVAVKLNSADFQRGGFSSEDAKCVVQMLNPLGVDLIELSGGSYEAPSPELPNEWRKGNAIVPELAPITWQNKPLASAAHMAVVKYQLRKHGKNKPAKPLVPTFWAFILDQLNGAVLTKRYKQEMAK